MLKRIAMITMVGALFAACQEDTSITSATQTSTPTVESIAAEDLPAASQTFIEDNFTGEMVTNAYKVTSSADISYEAYLTNNMNLVFAADGSLNAYGDASSLVDCSGMPQDSSHMGRGPGMGGPHGPGGPGGHGPGGDHHGNGTGVHPPKPVEVTIDSLPTAAVDYLDANYADATIDVILFIQNDSITQYHVLIKGVGAVIFDQDGNFVELRTPPSRDCGDFTDLDVADLPTAVTDYITANYPDATIVGARTGTIDDVAQIHVLLDEIGVLIFDQDGNFLDLKTCGMNRKRG